LVFRVTENPVIREIEFEGIGQLSKDELLTAMQTKTGEIYNAPRLAADGQTIEELYRSKGFILAIVVGQRMSEEGSLTLTIAEGVIEAVKITGNTRTKTHVIRRYIRTQEGETYNDRKVANDIARLMGLGYFETVRRDAEVGSEAGKVLLIITVVEKRRTGVASVGGGYSSVQGMVGFVDVTKTNLGGTGQMISLRGEFGGRTSYELGYRHPWIMTPETRLNLGLYDRLILREAFVTTEEQETLDILYDERRAGGNLTLGRPLSDRTTVYLGVRSDDVSVSGLTEEEEPYLTGAAFEPRTVRSLTLAAVTDTRDSIYNPRRGAFQQFSVEAAGIFGGAEFNKYSTDTRRYFPIGKRNVIALRLLAGTTSGDAPYLEQFLIGGSESLRGYRADRFAGSHMAILNMEYRFPLSENLLGVVFADVGDAWGGAVADEPYLQSLAHESFEAHVGYGVGIRVRTPIGPLRLDLGFSEEGTETHFGVKQMF
jgi:outer membrane protein insertion porin family